MQGLFQPPADRPRLELERTGFTTAMDVLAWLGVATHLMVVFFYWPRLPDSVPQHYDARGQVDAWGPLWMLALLPLLSLVMVAGMTWLMRYPHRYNFPWPITAENARRQYRLANDLLGIVRTVIAWLFCLISWEVCRLAVGESPLLGPLFLPLGLIPLFGSIAWYFVRAYRAR